MYADVESVLRLFQNFLVPKAETYSMTCSSCALFLCCLLLSECATLELNAKKALLLTTLSIPWHFFLAHDDGRSQLLLSLIGTVPIVYQSATYNIPVAFWLPTSYPSVAPIVFVTPTALMLVKAGKYVDISGRCYHPYLAYWSNRSDVSASICTNLCLSCVVKTVQCVRGHKEHKEHKNTNTLC